MLIKNLIIIISVTTFFHLSNPIDAYNNSITLPISLPGCQSTCGQTQIPYPFGIGTNCSRDHTFSLSCNKTTNKPFFFNVELIEISLSSGEAKMYNKVSSQCYNPNTPTHITEDTWNLEYANYPYELSSKRNKFTAVGCDTLAYIQGSSGESFDYWSGCIAYCYDGDVESLRNGSCEGIGCCQTAIPKGMKYYDVSFDGNYNSSRVYNFSPCSYAAVVEDDSFEFVTSYITSDELKKTNDGRLPLVVEWAIRNETCMEARRNLSSYACKSEHSECVEHGTNGYLCNCFSGYQGNPYLSNGCQDINECISEELNVCQEKCHNYDGGYYCECGPGYNLDPAKKGVCNKKEETSLPLVAKIIIGISVGTTILLFMVLFTCLVYQQKKIKKIRYKNFQKNGGWELIEELKTEQGIGFKIFTEEELKVATNNFKEIIGSGGHGTVYKGILKDREVAIKMSKIIDENQKKEFGKEMVILSQLNHKNIVKLLGCCLEVQVPMLVYEYLPNGTLFEVIHKKRHGFILSLDMRLRIALESAEALAYLHTIASPPIIHGDVKPSNILLDKDFTARVSDFGSSILIPKDDIQFVTLLQGTRGYLDPECMQTCQLTDKSDVYSFGVMIAELITGKLALSFEGTDQVNRSLANLFLVAMKNNNLNDILDNQVRREGEEKTIIEVANLAKTCLSSRGEERPRMKEVVEKLESITKFSQYFQTPQDPKEIQNLLCDSLRYLDTGSSNIYNLQGYDIDTGR